MKKLYEICMRKTKQSSHLNNMCNKISSCGRFIEYPRLSLIINRFRNDIVAIRPTWVGHDHRAMNRNHEATLHRPLRQTPSNE